MQPGFDSLAWADLLHRTMKNAQAVAAENNEAALVGAASQRPCNDFDQEEIDAA